MASVRVAIDSYAYECGDECCCYDYGHNWTLDIDSVYVDSGSSTEYEDAIAEALKRAITELGHTVVIEDLEESE